MFLATRDWYNPATTGGDNTMWEEARYLASVGHQITFVAARYAGASKSEVVDGINVVRLGGIHWLWLSSLLYYVGKCRGHFDVVVAEGFGGSRIPRFTPLYVREPIITEWHQIHRNLFTIQYPGLLNWPLNLLEKLAARVSRDTYVRIGTEDWRPPFSQIGFKSDHLFVLPVSIREDWLKQPGLKIVARDPIVLWVGKLRRYKCPDHAIKAMVGVIKALPEARLILAIRQDDRVYEQELKDLVARLSLEKKVEFRLNVSEAEKRELFNSASVLVVTSVVEGFGIVVLEANASGVPVVASSGVPDGAVHDAFNGLKYQFGDVNGLAEAVIRVLDDLQLRARLSENALDSVRRFEWSRVGAEFEQIVFSVANKKKVGASGS